MFKNVYDSTKQTNTSNDVKKKLHVGLRLLNRIGLVVYIPRPTRLLVYST